MSNLGHRLFSYDEYLALEAESLEKHEYFQGHILGMEGGTPTHAALASQVTLAIGPALRNRPCRLYSSDLRVCVEDTGLTTYPDLTVICGPLRPAPHDANAATNPTVLVEVLSPSTEAFDRGEKFAHYRQIPSLQDYVLVGSEVARVEVHHRLGDGSWRLTAAERGASVWVESLGLDLAVDAIYEGIELAPRSLWERDVGAGPGR
jgi:Uma2 family endonuclease